MSIRRVKKSEPQGQKKLLRLFAEWSLLGFEGPRAAAKYQRKSRKNDTRIEEEIRTRRWAVGLANFGMMLA